MTDKEVGTLWNLYIEYNPNDFKGYQIRALIAKLVDERARWKELITNGRCVGPCAINEAIRDFGINAETWRILGGPNEKET